MRQASKKRILQASACALLMSLSACGVHVSVNSGKHDAEKAPLPAHLTVADFVIGNPYGMSEIQIAENGEYVPYLVISDDYDGHCLLLRKDVLPDKMRFTDQEALFNTAPAYYPGSKVDAFLSDTFPERFSEAVRAALTDCAIEVYSRETVLGKEKKTETIQRKCFLLSAPETGMSAAFPCKDGREIPGLEDYSAAELNWLRTAYFMDDVRVWATSTVSAGPEGVSEALYLRPAMTVDGSTEVVAGKEEQRYHLACDAEKAE